jgi:cellulose biosynthesis protein BcsQ
MPLRTIAISINKGGQGKTTITKSLATAAVESGLNVLVLDVDTQQNSVDWRKRRDKQQADKPCPWCVFAAKKIYPINSERRRKSRV